MYCTPPFRKFDDTTATESWAFLFVPQSESPKAWAHIIKRQPKCVEWTETDIRGLVEESKLPLYARILGRITYRELMRFKVGLDGLAFRKSRAGDCAVAIISESERAELLSPTGFFRIQLQNARAAGAKVAVVYFGTQSSLNEVENFLKNAFPDCPCVLVPVPETKFLLDGITRVAVKTLLNSLSPAPWSALDGSWTYMIWLCPVTLNLLIEPLIYSAPLRP